MHKVSFTGSTAVGKLLMRQCAGEKSTLKKISLELGGNAPFIVFPDANIDAAVAGALICKFRSSGQVCVAANRIFVHDSVYDRFSAALVSRIRSEFVVGDGLATPRVTHGPLIHARAVEKTCAHVRDAVARGAKVLIGGNPMPHLGPNFFEPTVLADMSEDMQLSCEETFGPVAGLFRFSSEKEVVDRANDTEMGLAGYFYSQDVQRAWRVAKALKAGMIGMNTGLVSDPAAP